MTNLRMSEQLPTRFLVIPRFSLFSYLTLPFSQCLADGGILILRVRARSSGRYKVVYVHSLTMIWKGKETSVI